MSVLWIGLVILAAAGLDAALILRRRRRRRGQNRGLSAAGEAESQLNRSRPSTLHERLRRLTPGLAPILGGVLVLLLSVLAVRTPQFYWWPLEISLLLGLGLLGFGAFRIRAATLGRARAPRPRPPRQRALPGVESAFPESRVELALLFIAGSLLLFVGQAFQQIFPPDAPSPGPAFTIGGLVLSLLAIWGMRAPRAANLVRAALRRPADWMGVSRAQLVAMLLSLVLAWAVWLTAGDGFKMHLPHLAIGLWAGAIGLVIWSAWPRGGVARPAVQRVEVFAVGGLVLAALLLRAVQTSRIPWLLTGDEASGGLSALEFIEGRRDNPFNVAWLSFPSLYFVIQSLSIRAFGQTIPALRLTSAIAGAVTVGVLYGFAREAFGRRVALAAAAYLAAFHFHIHFSRLGLNNIWDGLFVTAFTLAFWKGWTSDSRLSFTLAGIVLGLAQYFYASVRVLLVLLPVWLLAVALRERGGFRRKLPHLVALGIAALVVVFPLAFFYKEHPPALLDPLARVVVWRGIPEGTPWWRAEGIWPQLATQFKLSALAFTGTDLRFWYQPDQPMLLPLAATLFLVGFVVLMLDLLKPAHTWMGLWLLGAVAVGALSESTPAAQRYVFVAPAVALVIALALERGVSLLSQIWPRLATALLVAGSTILLLAIWQDLRFYFGDFSPAHRFGDVNTEVATKLGHFLAEQPSGTRVFFLGGRMGYYSHSTVPYLAPRAVGEDVMETLTRPLEWRITGPTVFVLLPERRAELALIQEYYPGGMTIHQPGKEGPLYLAYYLAGS